MKMHRLLPLSLSLAVALGFAHSASAQSLSELYESARSYDAAYLAVKSQYDATLARADQARGTLLPSVNLGAGVTRSFTESKVGALAPTDAAFTNQQATLSASQPLYRPVNFFNHDQAKKQVEVVQAQLSAAEQDLMVRVTVAYFDVLGSIDSLTFVRAQKTAVAEQLAAAKRNFEVGASTITDTREAQARFDLVVAQEIAAENDLRVKRLALDAAVGRSNTQPLPLATPVKLPELVPNDVQTWVSQGEADHPQVRAATGALDVALIETDKARAGHKPTLDLTASHQLNRSPSGSAASSLPSRGQTTNIGVAFNLPLFAGYAVQNRIKETVALEEKARADLEAAKRAVAQATRTAFFGVSSGQGQVKALEAAEASSQSALDANRLGYQVGVRINIDVLNAQSQLFQTKRDLAKARYDVLVGGLRLRQASGTLKAEDLAAISAQLSK